MVGGGTCVEQGGGGGETREEGRGGGGGGRILGGATVPTLLDADEMHAATMRLDYILANRFVRPLRSARAIVNEDTCRLSDHYPVLAEFHVTSGAGARGESGTP